MREIEFRAFNKKNKTMSYFDLSDLFYCDDIENLTETFSTYVFMQYTGLRDRKGKKIYDGDIVKCWDWGVSPNELLGISVVEWDDDEKGWMLNPDPTDGDRYDLFRNVEVIGNIYENPKLLKKVEK